MCFLLLEGGDRLLLEDGGRLILDREVTASTSALPAVAAGVYALLNVSGLTDLATGGVWNHVPETVAYPFVRVDLVTETRWDRMSAHGREVLVDVNIWSQGRGDVEGVTIVDKVVELLCRQAVAVDCYAPQVLQLDRSAELPMEEVAGVVTRHWVVTVRARATQVA